MDGFVFIHSSSAVNHKQKFLPCKNEQRLPQAKWLEISVPLLFFHAGGAVEVDHAPLPFGLARKEHLLHNLFDGVGVRLDGDGQRMVAKDPESHLFHLPFFARGIFQNRWHPSLGPPLIELRINIVIHASIFACPKPASTGQAKSRIYHGTLPNVYRGRKITRSGERRGGLPARIFRPFPWPCGHRNLPRRCGNPRRRDARTGWHWPRFRRSGRRPG